MVTNNSFVDQVAFDGMRKHLMQDFTQIYHVDLHGNVRQNPKLSGTTHNVFGIQVGAGITIAVRSIRHTNHQLKYIRVPEDWRKEQKYAWLSEHQQSNQVGWQLLEPDNRFTWRVPDNADDYEGFIPIAAKQDKADKGQAKNIFKVYGRGLETTRDTWVYDFDRNRLAVKVKRMIEGYNGEIDRWKRAQKPIDIDSFVNNDETKIKWSSSLKQTFSRETYAEYNDKKLRSALYRPFAKQISFFDRILIHRPGIFSTVFPTVATEQENQIMWLKVGSEWPMFSLMANTIVDLLPQGGSQCFPFYTYDADGTNRRENITDWALAQFRDHYGDPAISKWDIFYYVYGVLHHPGYREKFADNLKRELPRIPYAPDFRMFANAGRALANLHLNYETVMPYHLRWIEAKDKPLSYRVEKMRLNKDKTQLTVNDSLTLDDIPAEAFKYRLGTRSALEWVIDQYQVSTDKRSGITSDPNREDDERYVVDLVGRVVAVSVETVRIVAGLPVDYSMTPTSQQTKVMD